MEIFPALSSEAIGTIVRDMDSRGFGVAENCISADVLTTLRQFIAEAMAGTGGEYIAFSSAEVEGTYLQELARYQNFQFLCRQIYSAGTHQPAPPVTFYNILRCLAGRTGEQNAYVFHYDSYVLTVLVPILIPTEGQPGDLILFPNTRPVRKTYLGNLIDKVLLDPPLTQMLLRKGVQSGSLKPEKIRMIPGNVYFFWGYRSIHANEPCDPDKIRATALFHYVDPHAQSWLRRTLLRLRNRQPLMTPAESGIKIPQPA